MPEYIKTREDFEKKLQEAGDKWVVVDFTASWCPPCKMIAPKFEAMSKEFTDILFYKVDVDENNETAEKEGIQAMPTFKFFKNCTEEKMIRGADEAKLREALSGCK